MSKRFFLTVFIAALMCCPLLYNGCAKKKYADHDARPSTGWVKDAVIYQVYLRSFSKEGTFQSLETRIPELKKLGVTIVSLMPIHPVGELNRRGRLGSPYAVKDFFSVNPDYGSLDDFKSLVTSLHAQGMKLILDLAADRAAWDSQLLMEHPDWFVHNEEGAIVSPQSEWIDVAQIDYRQHEPRKYILSMMKYWVKEAGIDGFRCCMSDLVPADFWEVARKEMEKIKPVVMISESSLPEHHLAAFDLSNSWLVYNALTAGSDNSVKISALDDSLKAEKSRFPRGSLHLNFTTTPEKSMEVGSAVERYSAAGAKTAAVLMFAFPGVPYIYNGEEVGCSRRLDLFNRTEIDWAGGSDMRALYEGLAAQRSAHPSLRSGSCMFLPNSDAASVLSFLRSSGSDSVLIVLSVAHEKKEVHCSMPPGSSMTWKDELSNTVFHRQDSLLNVSLDPFGFFMLMPAVHKENP